MRRLLVVACLLSAACSGSDGTPSDSVPPLPPLPDVEVSAQRAAIRPDQDLVLTVRSTEGRLEVRVGDAFVTSAEYKALYSAYEELREIDQPPLTVVDGGETVVGSREALVHHILAEGKKGIAISRYKGLGEMNADELWETTMNPEKRTLLQVRLEDEEVAENIFTTLMGDVVEPRRQFIEENALNGRNLDI